MLTEVCGRNEFHDPQVIAGESYNKQMHRDQSASRLRSDVFCGDERGGAHFVTRHWGQTRFRIHISTLVFLVDPHPYHYNSMTESNSVNPLSEERNCDVHSKLTPAKDSPRTAH